MLGAGAALAFPSVVHLPPTMSPEEVAALGLLAPATWQPPSSSPAGSPLDRLQQPARGRTRRRPQGGGALQRRRNHPTRGRWLRQLASGQLVLDRTEIAATWAGREYLLLTSDPDLSAECVAADYKSPLEAGRGFRDFEGTLGPAAGVPTRATSDPSARAAVLADAAAHRAAERRTGLSWRCIETALGRLHAVTLTGTAGTVVQTTPPPRVTTLHSPDLRKQAQQAAPDA